MPWASQQRAGQAQRRIANLRLYLLILAVPPLAGLAWFVTWQRPPITRLAFSPDGKFLAGTSDAPGAVRVWNLATDAEVLSIDSPSTASALAFSPDGEVLATAYQDGSIQFWTIATGQQRRATAEAPTPILAVAFSANGKKLVCVSATGAVDQCDVATGAAAYWAAHGRRIALRSVVLLAVAVAVAAGSAMEPFRASVPLHPWWWYVSINLTAAMCIACSLFVVRRGGGRTQMDRQPVIYGTPRSAFPTEHRSPVPAKNEVWTEQEEARPP